MGEVEESRDRPLRIEEEIDSDQAGELLPVVKKRTSPPRSASSVNPGKMCTGEDRAPAPAGKELRAAVPLRMKRGVTELSGLAVKNRPPEAVEEARLATLVVVYLTVPRA